MGAGLLLAAAPASLAGSVDPSTLQPPPPPGAKCHTAGNQIICDTILNFDLENQPDFDLPCGTLYLTGTDYREGFRFYVDGKIVRRHVTGAFNVTGSLSPTGDGPTIRLIARWNIWSVWPIPGGGDDDAIAIERGLSLRAIGPGLGSDFHISGQFDADRQSLRSVHCVLGRVDGRPVRGAGRLTHTGCSLGEQYDG